jgi:plasmid replication initiation protein
MALTLISKDFVIEKKNVLNEMRASGWALQELRFFSIYLSKINARDEKTRLVRFPMSEFQRIMELGRINIDYMKKVTDSLLCKLVHIPSERGGYTAFQLFKECKVDRDNNDEWYIEIDAHDKALPLMFDIKSRYFNYQLWNALRLRSPNQLRMYEILKQYEKIGERTLKLEELRLLLGIEPHEYIRWNNFKARIINTCQKVLAETTDIKYTYETIRAGRKGIVAVKFFIEKNTDYVDQLTLHEFIDIDDVERDYVINEPMNTDTNETTPPKKSPSEKKKALDEAKKSKFWHYAKEIAKKKTERNKNINATPESYAVGIVRNWEEAGYETLNDLLEAGEISKHDIDNKPSFDLEKFERKAMEKYKK